MRTTLTTLTAVLGLALGIAACTTDPGTSTAPKTTVTESAESTAPPAADTAANTDGGTGEEPDAGDREFTAASFGIAWNTWTEEQRDIMCSALDLLGTDGATDFYAQDVPDQGHMDWPHFTTLVQDECTARGSR